MNCIHLLRLKRGQGVRTMYIKWKRRKGGRGREGRRGWEGGGRSLVEWVSRRRDKGG